VSFIYFAALISAGFLSFSASLTAVHPFSTAAALALCFVSCGVCERVSWACVEVDAPVAPLRSTVVVAFPRPVFIRV
jgi:hypothetical protein